MRAQTARNQPSGMEKLIDFLCRLPIHRRNIAKFLTGHSLVGVGKIYIAKNRNGSIGIARFRYNPSFTRITDYIQPGTQTSLGL